MLQLGPFIGVSTRGGVVESLGTLLPDPTPNPAAIAVGLMTLAVVFLTPARIRAWIPSPLLALLVVTPLSLLLFSDDRLRDLDLEPLTRIGTIPDGGLRPVMPDFSRHLPKLVKAGLVLALLGAIDSLLTSLVADNITQTNHDSNRELIGQGIANSAAGFLSGLPGAGATMRTVINIKSGGEMNSSARRRASRRLVIGALMPKAFSLARSRSLAPATIANRPRDSASFTIRSIAREAVTPMRGTSLMSRINTL